MWFDFLLCLSLGTFSFDLTKLCNVICSCSPKNNSVLGNMSVLHWGKPTQTVGWTDQQTDRLTVVQADKKWCLCVCLFTQETPKWFSSYLKTVPSSEENIVIHGDHATNLIHFDCMFLNNAFLSLRSAERKPCSPTFLPEENNLGLCTAESSYKSYLSSTTPLLQMSVTYRQQKSLYYHSVVPIKVIVKFI